jgi:DNA-binding transcriptional LysR family regulator
VDVTGRVHTDSGPGVLASAVAGLGIAMASATAASAEVKAKMLVPLLRDYTLEPTEVHAVFPGGPRPSAKVRAFVDFLANELGNRALCVGSGPRHARRCPICPSRPTWCSTASRS